ncbi:hypothetical protein ElyMa_004547200 [Elysia marginata]|uniref:Reverse transcriptase domain-containing protein n=1 Tax=Elysia marginata TaxID=1093978 RepID=A0AAV4HSK0_9GAST|nr:hypothetical protein ElyMa_004547200 [Elysia marginata]
MRRSTEGKLQGIQWTPTSQLEDLHFADDIALLSHIHQQMQETTTTLNTTSKSLRLKVNKNKTKILGLKTNNNRPVAVENEELENVASFTYQGSTTNKEGGVEEDAKKRIQKARQAFLGLKKIWSSKIIKERKDKA